MTKYLQAFKFYGRKESLVAWMFFVLPPVLTLPEWIYGLVLTAILFLLLPIAVVYRPKGID